MTTLTEGGDEAPAAIPVLPTNRSAIETLFHRLLWPRSLSEAGAALVMVATLPLVVSRGYWLWQMLAYRILNVDVIAQAVAWLVLLVAGVLATVKWFRGGNGTALRWLLAVAGVFYVLAATAGQYAPGMQSAPWHWRLASFWHIGGGRRLLLLGVLHASSGRA